MTSFEIAALQQRIQELESENARLQALFTADAGRRARAETALAESEERYRTLFNSIDEGFCIIEFFDGPHGPLSDYIHIEANPAYALHAGIPNVVGQKVREMVPNEADGWVELYGDVLRSGAPIRFERELVATGRHLELAAFRVEPATRRQVAVLFQDITARKRAEAALQEINDTLEARVVAALAERKLLADIVEGTNAFVQVVDMQFRLIAINGAAVQEFERIFDVRPKVGDHLLELFQDLPEHRSAVRAVWSRALAGEEFVAVDEFGDVSRNRRFYEMRFSVLRDATGEQIGAYQFAYDVTDRLREQARLREAEEALRQSQKMEAVGQLTGGIAHDFNNLLTGIMGSLEMLQTRLRQGRFSDVDRYVAAAQGASKRAAALTHRLLAFSRRQTLDPKPTDVNRLAMGMEELVRRTVGPQITLEVVTAAGLWPALIDSPQLESALLNLCINARDAMPEGGRITIETANKWLDDRAARERDLPPGQYISLCVTDTGTGMTPDVIEHAFDPFFTTKPIGQGTGLGLSMVYGFARQSGGQVRIYSELGEGTTMCLYFPRHYVGEAEPADPDQRGAPMASSTGQTILVVDDEPTIRMLVMEVLDERGYAVIEAKDGPTGLAALQSNARIDLLITDVGLPGGMNGRQLADAARATRPGLKILFITGYAENAILS
ncbi:MAG: PAS domain-containing protein, partial [Bradyrhizobium sp.]|nr:PAS domain-containing protein [Bradyrhizobium sp.]